MFRSIKVETWIALMSTSIALAALWVAVGNSHQGRIHNMLSVRPVLIVRRVTSEDYAGITLSNKGLGPAIVNTFRYWADGLELGSWSDGVIRRTGLFGIPGVDKIAGVDPINTPIAAGEELRLIWIPYPKDKSDMFLKGASLGAGVAFKEITWDYCYCSVYGECWHSIAGGTNAREVKECSSFRSKYHPASSN